MTCKKIRPALLVTLALQQFCSPVFAQNSIPQQSEVTSSKALPTIKKPVKEKITPALKNIQPEQTITTQPLPEPAVVEAPIIYPPLPESVVEAPPPPPPLPKIISGVEYLKAPEPEYPPLSVWVKKVASPCAY